MSLNSLINRLISTEYFIKRYNNLLLYSVRKQFSALIYEHSEKQIDWNEVDRLYRFIASRVKEAEGKLQVIIVDHADLKDDLFQKMLIEKWWSKEKNLIPEDWYK